MKTKLKTNKSWRKRLKLTKSGKVLARAKVGLGHNKVKKTRRSKLKSKGLKVFPVTNKQKSRFLPNK